MSKNKIRDRIFTSFHRIEDVLAFAAVFLLALFPFMQVIARIFKTSVPYASDYMHHLVLVVTFIGGIITSREGKHLSLSLALKIEDPLKTRIHTGIMLISAMMTTAFCWSALSFLLTGFDPSKKIGIFPIRLIGLVMVVGYAIMAIRFVTRTSKEGWYRVIAAGGILLGTFIALDPIAKILAYFYEEIPGYIEFLLRFLLVGVIMVIGYALIPRRFLNSVPLKGGYRVIAAVGFLVGTFIILKPISAKILATFYEEIPGYIEFLLQFAQSANAIIALPIIILLIIAAVLGAPLFVVLGGMAYMLFARVGEPLGVIANESYAMLISHSIPAIPLFTVAGFLLSESKAGERLVQFFRAFFAWFPGGLAIMAILVCAFFTTFTGASGVTILALGALLSYVLVSGKYERKFSVGLLTASGSVGLLFPPSLPIIIYGVIAGVSIKDMFIGGIVPGFVLVLTLVIFSIIYASKRKIERQPFKIKEAFSAVKASIWEILLPIIILLVYFGGLANLEESAAIAVIYALVVEVVIKRDLKIRDLPGIISKSVPIIGGILIILSLAKGLSFYIVDAEVPMKLTEWVQASITSKYVFLLLLNIGLLITGCFMDIFSAIMVVVPLIIPLGNIFGIHPVHLGIIFLANMELGYMTPPVGLNLFLASYRFNEPMGKLYKDVFPFFLIRLAPVLLITYVPFLTTALLGLF